MLTPKWGVQLPQHVVRRGPLERVWEVLSDPVGYPQWWKGVRKATVLEPGEAGSHGVGTLYRLEWRRKLPCSVVFDSRVTRLQPPHLLEGRASGELERPRRMAAVRGRRAPPRSTAGTSARRVRG